MKRQILKILTACVITASAFTCLGIFDKNEAKATIINTKTEMVIKPLNPDIPRIKFQEVKDEKPFDENDVIPISKETREAINHLVKVGEEEKQKRIAAELERKRQEELARREQNRKLAINNVDNLQPVHLDRGGTSALWNTQLALTFYTDLAVENGGWANITTSGKPLKTGAVATGDQIPFGTVFMSDKLNKYIGSSTVIVEDRMLESESYKCNDNQIRVDVFVPRRSDENEYSYLQRVNSMGRPTISASVLRWGR